MAIGYTVYNAALHQCHRRQFDCRAGDELGYWLTTLSGKAKLFGVGGHCRDFGWDCYGTAGNALPPANIEDL